MANVTNVVYEFVRSHNGIKCADIANGLSKPLNSVSGTLSILKYRGMVFNENAKWYATNSPNTIKRRLDDIHESLQMPFGDWAEGYVNALVDYNIINESEFDELMEYITTKK